MSYFDYETARRDVIEAGGDPDDVDLFDPERRDRSLRKYGLNPAFYGGGKKDPYDQSAQHKQRHPGTAPTGGEEDPCYITTACVRAGGLPDDCRELNTMRSFRDRYLRRRVRGYEDIETYYAIAPKIVAGISARSDADKIWAQVYRELIVPCVALIDQGQTESVYHRYKAYTYRLLEEYGRE